LGLGAVGRRKEKENADVDFFRCECEGLHFFSFVFRILLLEIKFLTFSGGLHRSGIWMVKRFEFGFEFSCLSVGRTNFACAGYF
jgi:hypothetical protein